MFGGLKANLRQNFQLLESLFYISIASDIHVVIHESVLTTISLNKCHMVQVSDHVIIVLAKQHAFVDILPNSA